MMKSRIFPIETVFTLSASVVLATAAHANLIPNGDFEASPFASGWSAVQGEVTAISGLVPGSTTAARIDNVAGTDLVANVPSTVPYVMPPFDPDGTLGAADEYGSTGPLWQLSFNFAAEAPGAAANRTLNFHIGHSTLGASANTPPLMNFRLTGDGGASVFREADPRGWQEVFPAGTVNFASLSSPVSYFIQFDGDYSTSSPSYTVSLREAGETEFSSVSTSLSHWQYAAPEAGDGVLRVRYFGAGNNSPYAIDNVSLIPEPSTYALIVGLGLLGLVGFRRLRR